MTMPSSGALNLGGTSSPVSVAQELGLGLTSTIAMNTTAVRTLAGAGTGSTSWGMNSLYGKSSGITISSNQTNLNLRTYAVSAGWNQSSPLFVTIDSGIYISSNATGTPALTISGSFPGGVSVVNNGLIIGMGGAGGGGGTYPNSGQAGSAGGTALSVSSAVTITNNGTIGGGGGGGGGGGANSFNPCPCYPPTYAPGGGGGGGRSSFAASSNGGAAGSGGGASAGSAGTVSAAGNGGAAASGGGPGGNGGNWGSSGANGTSLATNGGTGGSSGAAVSGNSNITWVAFGTRLGSIS